MDRAAALKVLRDGCTHVNERIQSLTSDKNRLEAEFEAKRKQIKAASNDLNRKHTKLTRRVAREDLPSTDELIKYKRLKLAAYELMIQKIEREVRENAQTAV